MRVFRTMLLVVAILSLGLPMAHGAVQNLLKTTYCIGVGGIAAVSACDWYWGFRIGAGTSRDEAYKGCRDACGRSYKGVDATKCWNNCDDQMYTNDR
jgi:hypothetical protein